MAARPVRYHRAGPHPEELWRLPNELHSIIHDPIMRRVWIMKNIAGVLGIVAILYALQNKQALLVIVLIAAVIILGRLGSRSLRANVHGGDRAFVALHEAGHVIGAEEGGGRVTDVYADESGGYVTAMMPTDDPVARVAFYYAGAEAAGDPRGASYDFDQAERVISRDVSFGSRGYVRKEGARRARQIVRRNAGRIDKVARRIERKGTL